MTETRTDSGESRGSSTGPISVTGLDSAAVADAKDAVASTTPAGPTAPDEVAESERSDNDPADEPKPRRRYWRELRTWAHGIADRLNKPPREIFADGRVYNRIRISTVVLMVAFLSVLWVYQVSRPAPTDPAAPAPEPRRSRPRHRRPPFRRPPRRARPRPPRPPPGPRRRRSHRRSRRRRASRALRARAIGRPRPPLEPTPLPPHLHQPQRRRPANDQLASLHRHYPRTWLHWLSVIRLENVSKSYRTSTRPALDKVNVKIDKGEFAFLIGPSGSGKSTFLKLLLKDEAPTSGDVFLGDFHVNKLPGRRVPKLRQVVGCVFQDFRLLQQKSVQENVAFALEVIGKRPDAIAKVVPEVLELVGLSGKANRLPHELSGGEQQRVAIARAFVNRPLLLLADEPTGNLDPDTSGDIMLLLDRINRTGTTVLMATHDHEIVDSMRRRVIELQLGKVVRDEARGVYGVGR